ncbi:MAG: FecR domain-containing protein [Pseudomonadota bacterium]
MNDHRAGFLTKVSLATSVLFTPAAVLAASDGVELRALGGAAETRRIDPAQIQGARFEAPADRVVEILLPDGTTLVLAPNTTAEVTCFESGSCLDVSLERGAMRVVGRRTGEAPVVVTTPAGSATLRSGAASFELRPDDSLRVALLFGPSLVVENAGESVELRVAGYAVTSAPGSAPGNPEQRSAAEFEAETVLFNPAAGFVLVAPGAGPEDQGSDAETDVVSTTERATIARQDAQVDSRSLPPPTTPDRRPARVTSSAVVGGPSGPPVVRPPIVLPLPEPVFGFGEPSALAAANPFGGKVVKDYALGESATTESAGLPGFIRNLSQSWEPVDSDVRFPGLTASRMYNDPESAVLATTGAPLSDVVPLRELRASPVPLSTSTDGLDSGARVTDGGVGRTLQYQFFETAGNVDSLRGGESVFENLNFLGLVPLSRGLNAQPDKDFLSTEFPDIAIGYDARALRENTFAERPNLIYPTNLPSSLRQNVGLPSGIVFQNGFLKISDGETIGTNWERAEIPTSFDEGFGFTTEAGFNVYDRRRDNFIIVEQLPVELTRGGLASQRLQDEPSLSTAAVLELVVQPGDPGEEDVVVLPGGSTVPISVADQFREKLRALELGEQLPYVDPDFDLAFDDPAAQENALVDYANQILNPEPDLAAGVGFVWATGAVSAALDDVRREDRFQLASRLVDFARTNEQRDPALNIAYWSPPVAGAPGTAGGSRGFLRNATRSVPDDPSGPLALADTGLRTIGTPAHSERADLDPTSRTWTPTAAVHADFGIEGLVTPAGGDRASQRSTISVTVGDVAYGVQRGYQPIDELLAETEDLSGVSGLVPHETVLTARTVGSSRGFSGDTSRGSVVATADQFTIASGGGNPSFGDEAGTIGGRAGYFVLDNYDPVILDDVDRYATGGLERPVGSADGTGFATLRLAFGTESQSVVPPETPLSALQGFAAGMAESVEGGVLVARPVGTQGARGLVLTFDRPNNHMLANMALYGLDDPASTPTSTELGGLGQQSSRTVGASALLDGERFAARTATSQLASTDMAMVSASLLAEGATSANAETQALLTTMTSSPADPATGQPVYQWGFFFGDATVDDAPQHVHLGFWVAGETTNPALLDDWATTSDLSKIPGGGTATYSGAAIGNVANAGQLYTAQGTYTNTWDFRQRTGATSIAFDGATLHGATTNPANTAAFGGVLQGGDRIGRVDGTFVGSTANAQIGRFDVSNGASYNATGTFAASR